MCQLDILFCGLFRNAACFLAFCQQRRQDTTGRNVVLKLEPIADDFINAEMQRNGPYLKIKRPCDKHVAVGKPTRRLDKRFGLRENGWLQRDLKEVVR